MPPPALQSTAEIQVSLAPPAASLPADLDPSDHELMVAVRGGDIARLGALFERYQHRLYGFFLRLTGQPALSEDLVQIVFYRILKYRHTYRDEGKFTAWIYHLARKVAADHFRKQARTPSPTDPTDLQAHADERATPETRAATTDDLALLQTALARLPLEHREVLVLSRLQHLEHREIARLHDCSVGAVKVRVHRALKQLREIYFKLRREQPA